LKYNESLSNIIKCFKILKKSNNSGFIYLTSFFNSYFINPLISSKYNYAEYTKSDNFYDEYFSSPSLQSIFSLIPLSAPDNNIKHLHNDSHISTNGVFTSNAIFLSSPNVYIFLLKSLNESNIPKDFFKLDTN